MKIVTVNQHGQVTLPFKIRKNFQINKNTPIKIFTRNNEICMQVLDIENEDLVSEKTLISFPKDQKIKDFHFKSKNSSSSLAEEIDDVIY